MNLAHSLGWTLVHSLWEIAIVAALLLVGNVFLSRSNARGRYAFALTALALCIMCPLTTFLVLKPNISDASSIVAPSIRAELVTPQERPSGVGRPIQRSELPVQNLADRIDAYLPKAVIIWLAGIAFMCLRLIGGLALVLRLKGTAALIADPKWRALLLTVKARMGVKANVGLMVSDRVETPIVVGLLKSAIIFPTSALLKLSTHDVEALLAHELAHIRRYDTFVNLLQTVIESVLFFHPAVWWISSIVRTEREHCCDDHAIAAIGNRAQYATALFELEQIRQCAPKLAMAANRGSLLARVRRILLPPQRPAVPFSLLAAMLLMLAVGFGLASGQQSHNHNTEAQSNDKLSVTGTIVDVKGRPVTGAMVICVVTDTSTGKTRELQSVSTSGGKYDFQTEPFEDATVCAYRKDLGVGIGLSHVTGEKALRLHPAVSAKVLVTDSAGHPLSGVRVGPGAYVFDSRSNPLPMSFKRQFWAKTNASGVAEVQGMIAGGRTQLDTDDPRYVPNSSTLPSVYQGGSIKVTLTPACKIKGTVTVEGKPVEGAQIFGRGLGSGFGPYITDKFGTFEIDRVKSGSVHLSCTLPNELSKEWTVRHAHLVTLPVIDTLCNFKLERGSLMKGTVRKGNGQPGHSISVELLSAGESFLPAAAAQTDEEGKFQVRVPSGEYALYLYDKYQTSNMKVLLRDGETKKLDLTSPASEDAANIKCSVFDASGKKINYPHLESGFINSSAKSPEISYAYANGDRSAAETILHPLNSQAKYLWVEAYTETEASDRVVVGSKSEVILRMHRIHPAIVSGQVRDSSGSPLRGVDVCLMRFFEPGRAMRTDEQRTNANGEYSFSRISKKGTYVVMAQGQAVADSFTGNLVIVPNGQQIKVRSITMPPGHAIRGRVVDQHGKAIPRAQIVAINEGMPFGSQCESENDGTFAIYRLASGSYTLTITRDGRKSTLAVNTDSNTVWKLAP